MAAALRVWLSFLLFYSGCCSDLPWPCPGVCWSHPSETDMVGTGETLWDTACPHCSDVTHCAYGTYPHSENNCGGCSDIEPSWHWTSKPTNIIQDCAIESFVCDKGYYNPLSTFNGGACMPCFAEGMIDCGKGRYLKRCIELEADSGNSNDYCDNCDNPKLPDPNEYRYGRGRLYQDCSDPAFDLRGLGPSACAWFLTPKWNTGLCSIECNNGYMPTVSGPPYPLCSKCNTSCPLGWKPPKCPGGNIPILGESGDCEICANHLPLNAHWLPANEIGPCIWECSLEGHYRGNEDLCRQCVALEVCPAKVYFMGCNKNNSGQCVECSISKCEDGNFYLKSEIWMDACACVRCSSPVLGVSYTLRNCSFEADAIIDHCSNSCESYDGSFYVFKACTLWSNTICAKCSPAPYQGLLLISKCTLLKDAIYGPCMPGLACNGTAVAYSCSTDKVAVNGVCICKPATTPVPGKETCVPILCPRIGMYPDSVTGSCLNCTTSQQNLISMSKEGVLGIDACGCLPGYFVQILTSTVRCWPCGDLGCIRGIQRQSTCLGFEQTEPTCNCALAPGTELIAVTDNNNMCTLKCANGYHATTANAVIYSGLYDKFSLISMPPSSLTQVHSSTFISNIQKVVLVDQNMAVILHNDGKVSVGILNSGSILEINLDRMFIYGYARVNLGKATAILAHQGSGAGGGGFIWIAFTYWGLCEDVDNSNERNCSAIELVSLVNNPTCNGGVCIGLTSHIWGNMFPSSGTSKEIYSMTFDIKTNIIFMAIGNHGRMWADTLIDYEVKFYQIETPDNQRVEDYPLHVLGYSDSQQILDISIGGGGGLYILTTTGLMKFIVSLGTWTRVQQDANITENNYGMSSLRGHEHDGQILHISATLLIIQIVVAGSAELFYVIDTLNNIAAPMNIKPSVISKIAFRDNMLLNFNGTIFNIYSEAVPCPIDTILYEDSNLAGECVAMQCVFSDPCGPNSIRMFGESTCSCIPGHYQLSLIGAGLFSCVPCGSTLFYCPGGTSAISCPENSITKTLISKSISECLCLPGYYHFGSRCIPCPKNMWCPSNGTTTPIACYASGTTNVEGKSSPIYCSCPARTHGLLCSACDDSMDCVPIDSLSFGFASSPVPTLESVNVKGWGPIWGEEIARECLSKAMQIDGYIIYSILGVDSYTSQVSTERGLAPDSLNWNWIFVLRDPMPEGYISMGICFTQHGFTLENMQVLDSDRGTELKKPLSCGVRKEWSGLTNSPCTCMAGYESMMTSDWGYQCFPCLKGTFRKRRSTLGCIACTGDHEDAPYLGMIECVCVDGYKRSIESGQCIDATQYAPSWYSDLSSPSIIVTLCIAGGCIFIGASILIASYF